MRRILGGTVLVIAGIAAFIEAHSHRPVHDCESQLGSAPCPPGDEGQLLPPDPALALRIYAQAMRQDEAERAKLRALVAGGELCR
jgi:hypothetical protein